MNDLSYLSTLDDATFEAERCKIIANEILKAPPETRKQLVRLQMQLDQVRNAVTPEKFIQHCFHLANENLENMADQFAPMLHVLKEPERKVN